MTTMPRLHRRLANQHGTALIMALMSTMLLTALAAAVIMVTTTETRIASNYATGRKRSTRADAAVERVVQDLLLIPRWNDVLSGAAAFELHRRRCDGVRQALPSGGSAVLCSGANCAANTATGQLQATTDAQGNWGANNPQVEALRVGTAVGHAAGRRIDSPMYVAVWVATIRPTARPDDADGNPLVDTNGVLTLHAEAYGPSGTRKTVEVTIARTSSTEIERGQIAQRGQEELNQRARKAAVQTARQDADEHAHEHRAQGCLR